MPHLDGWLAGLFTPQNRRHTIDQLAAAQDDPDQPDPAATTATAVCGTATRN